MPKQLAHLLLTFGLLLGCQPPQQPLNQAPTQVTTKIASQHLDAGLQFIQTGQHEKALVEFSAAIELEPSAHAYSNRGLIYSGLGEHEKSLADHNQAVKLAPDDALAYYNRSLHYSATGKHDKAIADLNESIRLKPTLSAALSARGAIWQELGEYEKAVIDFRQAVILSPDHFLACNDLAWLLATCPDDQIRNGKEAVGYAAKAVELSRQSWMTVDTLAGALAEIGEFEQAIATQQMAIEAAPEDQHPEMKSRLELYRQQKPYRLGNPGVEKTDAEETRLSQKTLITDLAVDAVSVLEQIADVQKKIKRSGPNNTPTHRIIHLADYHFVERSRYAADLRSLSEEPLSEAEIDEHFHQLSMDVEGIQAEQGVLLRDLIKSHGLKAVHIEGLSQESQPVFEAKLSALRKLREELVELRKLRDELLLEGEPDEDTKRIADGIMELEEQVRLDLLQMGIAARFFFDGELGHVLPLEEEAAYRAADPVNDNGTVTNGMNLSRNLFGGKLLAQYVSR